MNERLQKIIARAGIASRRHAEELISSGLVTVNGRTITELGSKADESRDHIKVSGKLLRPASERVYLLLNKPAEVVSTMSDPEGGARFATFCMEFPTASSQWADWNIIQAAWCFSPMTANWPIASCSPISCDRPIT